MGYVLVGSPDTVVRLLAERGRALGSGRVIGLFQVGDMPHKRAIASMELFARQVMPRVREATAVGA